MGYHVKCASDSVDLLTTSLELRPQHLVLAPVREQAACSRSNSYAGPHRFGSSADALRSGGSNAKTACNINGAPTTPNSRANELARCGAARLTVISVCSTTFCLRFSMQSSLAALSELLPLEFGAGCCSSNTAFEPAELTVGIPQDGGECTSIPPRMLSRAVHLSGPDLRLICFMRSR